MANRQNGEVALKAGGATWTLRYSIPVMDGLEDELDQSSGRIIDRLIADPRIKLLRTLLRAGLSEHHGELDDAQVDGLIHELTIVGVHRKLLEAFAAAFPQAEEGAEGEAGPRKAAGTGAAASTPGSSSASETPPPSGD